MSDSFDALSRPSEEDDAHQSLFPRMEKLAVDWGECYDDLANSVMDMIRSRSHPQGSLEAGAGEFSLPQPTYLRELHLKGCRMSRDQAEELEHVFGNAVKFDSVRVRIPS
ncbi:hypothetical protein M407DRAFT_101471 [Tulasnella calospora MUT 4182]|uniref:Uncharacterized protein n=1 Tax=Tulasnella calospora MUT 4182 TaxID=1051891 RepID=A0A0C3LSW4_9AGAM|nr:hypothetical protein M407DRAFT_101471 [Tulasnella calospora MUT 4182]